MTATIDTSSRDQLCGRTVGEFVLRERIGEGGFGAVYRCEQPLLGREAVVKVLHHRLRENELVQQRFLREAQLASRLDHPYAAHIYAFGVDAADGMFWIAMEMVHGTTLSRYLDERGALPVERMLPFFERVAEVVQTAHERGIVHRDLKPSNIMVIERAGQLLPKLLDFGIAKVFDDAAPTPPASSLPSFSAPAMPPRLAAEATTGTITSHTAAGIARTMPHSVSPAISGRDEPLTQANAMIGSPPYMSPEQWVDATTVGPRSDLYALAIVAYEMLTGRRPFVGATIAELAELHCHAPVPPVGDRLPVALDEVFQRALAKRPEDRRASALELAAALRVASGLGVDPTELPKLDRGVTEAWLADAPQPLAEAVAALDGARNAHQSRDAARDLYRALIRYLLALALAGRAQVRADRDPPALLELLRALKRRELDDDERIRLLRLLLRPLADRRGAHPVPELVDLVVPHDGHDELDRMLQLHPTSDASISEGLVRSHLAQFLPELARLMRAAAFVLDYALVVPRDGNPERWTGLRRQRRAIAVVRDTPHAAGPMLVDRERRATLLLAPLVQVIEPTAGAEPELFVFDGRGRHGARMTAAPMGFEHHDPAVWDWLGEHIIGEVDRDSSREGDDRAPYLGLASFSTADADRFVGREREVDAFVNRVRKQALHIVVGPSGAGKSSFVHAGVVPALPAGWRTIAMRPGASPTATLAARLAAAAASATDLHTVQVVIVDQLEELFTLCSDAGERAQFGAALASLAASPDMSARVLCTVRDDFLMHVEALPGLRAALSPALFLLGNPSRDDLVRTIVEPARRVGYELSDPELAGEMVDAVADRPGALALLSFTASQLWELRDRQFHQLTRKAYDAMGGVGGALQQHAEATFAALPGDDQRTARAIFRQLVTSERTRAVLTVDELRQRVASERATAVIDKLVAARLLSAADAGGEAHVEIIHEALIRAWPRLDDWLREDVEDARMREQLRTAARQWDERKRPRGLLWRDDVLAELERWRRRPAITMTELERAFADASRAATARSRRLRTAVIATAFAVLAAGLVVLWALNRSANDARASADTSAAEAHQRVLDLGVEQGRQALLARDPMRALVYLGNAYSGGARGSDLQFMIARASADLDAQQHVLAHASFVRTVAYSPDGKLLATGDDRGARLWDAATGAPLHFLPHPHRVWSVAFSPDGEHVLTSCEDGSAQIWGTAGKTLLHRLPHPKPVQQAVYSPDGRVVATASWDHAVRLWDAASGQLLARLSGHGAFVRDLAFRSDGARLVSSSEDGTARVWAVPSGELIATLHHTNWVMASRFSPDRKLVATASFDRTVGLWDAETGRPIKTLKHAQSVEAIDFSPDGNRLVSATDDLRATVWDVASGDPTVPLLGHTDYVVGARFSPDGARILTWSADGTARTWDATTGVAVMTYVGHTAIVWAAVFDPSGAHVATAGFDHTARIWNARASRVLASTAAALDEDGFVSTSVDGNLLIPSTTGRPTLRSAETGALIERAPIALPGRASWSVDRRRILALAADGVRCWSADGNITVLLPNTAGATVAELARDGTRAVVGFQDRATEIWETTPPRRIAVLTGGEQLSSASFGPDASLLVTGHRTGSVVVWDVASSRRIADLVGHERRVAAVTWSPDGRLVASAGGFDQTARIWDVRTGQQLAVLQGHTGEVRSVAFHPTGQFLATGSTDNTASVWSVNGALLVSFTLNATVGWAGFTRDGGRLVTMTSDPTAKAPPAIAMWSAELDRRSPDALAAYVRCRVPFVIRGERMIPEPTRCVSR